MNFKRICTAIIALILVVCLMVDVSPIKAEATGLGLAAAIASVPAAPVIGAVLIGLGISVGAVASNWDKVVDDLVDHYTAQGVIDSNGNMDIYSLTGAGYQYGIAEGIISGIRDWAFENEIVTENTHFVADGYWLYNGYEARPYRQDVDTSAYPYIIISNLNNTPVLYFFDKPVYVIQDYSYMNHPAYQFFAYEDGGFNYVTCDFTADTAVGWTAPVQYSKAADSYVMIRSYKAYLEGDTHSLSGGGVLWSNYDIYGSLDYNYGQLLYAGSKPITDGTTTFDIATGLVAGQLASAADSIAAGYTKWAEKYVDLSVLDPDLPSAVYPISYAPTNFDVHGLTQEQVWSGVLSGVTLPDDDVITPDPDIGAISVALGDVNTSVFLNALADHITTLPLIPPRIEDAIEQLPIYLGDIRDYIETFPKYQDNLLDHLEQIPIHLGDIRDFIETFPKYQDDIRNYIEQFPDRLSIAFEDVKVGVRSIADTLTKTLADTKAIAAERVGVITEAAVGVFVPSEGYIDSKVEALTLEFPVVEDIKQTGEDLKDFFVNLGQKPPIIYIDLGAQRGFHNIGGRTAFIDLTWYAEYKPTMDAILSAFLWLWFAWRMFLSAPGILQGAAGSWRSYESHAGKDASAFKGDSGGKSDWNIPFGYTYQDIKEWHEDTIAEYEHLYGRRR